ncbi:MAG: HAMP domain-containing sensor histidine kinase [Chloroflexota bacterium]|nr:HAMP domain-containing sensor histidine kinase [Chloroflexota bacterium]
MNEKLKMRQRFHIRLFWQLLIAFALVIILVGGGMFLAGRAALNRLEPLARDKYTVVTHIWADRLAGYYEQQGGWAGVDALVAGYPCGPGWEPWDENWQMDYALATTDGTIISASDDEQLGRRLVHWELDQAIPIVVNDRQVGFLTLFPFYHLRLGFPSVIGYALQRFLMAGLAIGTGSLIVVLILSRGMSRPLVNLTAATRSVAEGDLSVRVPTGYPGEAGDLAAAFNQMADQVEETIVTLRRFVSDAAHEIHTPLTALRTNLELAPDDDFVQRAKVQVSRLEMLTEGLLNLSRIEAGEQVEAHAPLAMVPLVQEMGELYASQGEQAGLTFDLVLPETPVTVQGNEAQLRRALGNLLDNSIKFTPEGGTVSVGLRQEDQWAELWVEDAGIGIPEEDLSHLFSRFHRGRNTAAYPGSGLGLAIVKAVAEGHGGTVMAENTESGARFTLRLPVSG